MIILSASRTSQGYHNCHNWIIQKVSSLKYSQATETHPSSEKLCAGNRDDYQMMGVATSVWSLCTPPHIDHYCTSQ